MTRSGLKARRLVERRLAVAGDAHLVALQAQRALQDLGDLLVVLDDEHAWVASGDIHVQRTTVGRYVKRALRQIEPHVAVDPAVPASRCGRPPCASR